MLERFRKAQQEAVQRLILLDDAGRMPPAFKGPRPAFAARLAALGPGAIIAEYKRASPSHGDINLAARPEDIARDYDRAGAAAISVLTEQSHFKGDVAFLGRMAGPGLPLLRKDFLIHPVQVRETAATPASALLLIARLLDEETFARMIEASRACGLEAVLEVFDRADLDKVRRALKRCERGLSQPGPVIIQVNNRDLDSLTVSDAPSRELIGEKKSGEVWISASGVSTAEDVRQRAAMGFEAVLIGASLMQGAHPGQALAALCGRGGASDAKNAGGAARGGQAGDSARTAASGSHGPDHDMAGRGPDNAP